MNRPIERIWAQCCLGITIPPNANVRLIIELGKWAGMATTPKDNCPGVQ